MCDLSPACIVWIEDPRNKCRFAILELLDFASSILSWWFYGERVVILERSKNSGQCLSIKIKSFNCFVALLYDYLIRFCCLFWSIFSILRFFNMMIEYWLLSGRFNIKVFNIAVRKIWMVVNLSVTKNYFKSSSSHRILEPKLVSLCFLSWSISTKEKD